jgi:uncharacterized Tic20 family protein
MEIRRREMSEEYSKVKYEQESAEIPVTVREKPKNGTQASESFRDSMGKLMAEDRFWAALAHAIGPVMIALMVLGDGGEWLGLILITAGIYVYFANKSPMIKFHARQALAAQLLGTFGWFAVLISGTLLWVVLLLISLVLILVLIGLILAPLVAITLPIFILASFVMPLSVVVFGAIGAWETWHGRHYRYPYLADCLDEKLGTVGGNKEIVVA